jgi:hypothetical protein
MFANQQQRFVRAFLLPLKVYTVGAGLALFLWRSLGPREPSDLAYFARYAIYGYYAVAALLISGSLLQWLARSRSAALWSAGFAVTAIIVALLLRSYLAEGDLQRLATSVFKECLS